jgi:hypothetical protein
MSSLVEKYIKVPTPHLNWAKRHAMRAQAYYELAPYPVFGFTEWKTEDRGPLPKCMPFCANLVKRPARWLFGKPPRITCDNVEAGQPVLDAFKRTYHKLVKAAVRSMIEGSVSLRFAYNFDTKQCVFSFLSTLDNVRYITDPHDESRVVLVFVQYTYFDENSGKWLWHREAWTDSNYIIFKPQEARFSPVRFGEERYYGNVAFVAMPDANGTFQSPDTFTGWEIDKISGNPLGFIPVIQIKNEEGDTPYGEGIIWRVTHILDRINLAYHLMDRSNQFDSDPTTVFIDAEFEVQDVATISPGGVSAINTRESADSGNRQAKVTLLEPSGRLRPYMSEYVNDLRHQVCTLTGTVEISDKELSNKGNFTQSVLNQIYAPLIESTDARRSVWEARLEEFLGNCAKAVAPFFGKVWTDSDKFNVTWPDYFILPEQEKGIKLDRLIRQESLGLITKDRVIQQVASMDGVEDVDAYLEELKTYEPEFDDLVSSDKTINDENLAESRLQSKNKSKEDTVLQ